MPLFAAQKSTDGINQVVGRSSPDIAVRVMRMPNTTAAAEQVAVVAGTDLVAVLACLPGSGLFPGTPKGQEPGQDQLSAQALVAPTSARAGEVGLMDAPA